MNARLMVRIVVNVCLVTALGSCASAEEYDREPIRYSTTDPNNRVSRLIEQIQTGATQLVHEPRFGYLRSLLKELQVPESSQTLVFSKTSLQRQRISPRTPRALYFNDEIYIGFCQHGEVLELSTADPLLGTVFYTVEQDNAKKPRIARQGENCLICHGSSQTKEIPGHLVRSVFVDPQGLPMLAAGTYRIDQTSPLENRWGGWYVTGTHGAQRHLGNLVIHSDKRPDRIDNRAGMNVTQLDDRFDASAYLSGHSDIVALMVLEHQTDAHNLITRANFAARQALHYQQSLNRELGEPPDYVWDSCKSRIKSAGDPLVEYLLFSGEAKLTHRIQGTTTFAQDFVERGPRDHLGRSLRDFDLETRMFKYPCSYLIYSPSFDNLPEAMKTYVVARLRDVLTGKDQSPAFAHLSADDRAAILQILNETKPGLWD
jgi:hypothetical protein